MLYFMWGCRGNFELIAFGNERILILKRHWVQSGLRTGSVRQRGGGGQGACLHPPTTPDLHSSVLLHSLVPYVPTWARAPTYILLRRQRPWAPAPHRPGPPCCSLPRWPPSLRDSFSGQCWKLWQSPPATNGYQSWTSIYCHPHQNMSNNAVRLPKNIRPRRSRSEQPPKQCSWSPTIFRKLLRSWNQFSNWVFNHSPKGSHKFWTLWEKAHLPPPTSQESHFAVPEQSTKYVDSFRTASENLRSKADWQTYLGIFLLHGGFTGLHVLLYRFL